MDQTEHITPDQHITIHQPNSIHSTPPTELTQNINPHFEPDLSPATVTHEHTSNHPTITSSRVSHHPSYLQDYIFRSLAIKIIFLRYSLSFVKFHFTSQSFLYIVTLLFVISVSY